MGILMFLIHKFFVFTFMFAILFLIREAFRFIRGLNTGEYETKKYTVLWVGIAIAHILTTFITGFII